MTWYVCKKCGFVGTAPRHFLEAGCEESAEPTVEDSEAENDHVRGLEQNESELLDLAMDFDVGGEG